jgi:hypothetical protein
VTGPLASSPRWPIAMCPGPRARGSSAVVWSPPATPPPRAGGPSAVGHALDTGSHRPHVRHPPPEDAPILSSLRKKPLCCPLLAAERHAKLPASLLFVQRSTVSAAQPSMSNGGEQTPGMWTRALLRLPDTVAILKALGEQRRSDREADAVPFPP